MVNAYQSPKTFTHPLILFKFLARLKPFLQTSPGRLGMLGGAWSGCADGGCKSQMDISQWTTELSAPLDSELRLRHLSCCSSCWTVEMAYSNLQSIITLSIFRVRTVR